MKKIKTTNNISNFLILIALLISIANLFLGCTTNKKIANTNNQKKLITETNNTNNFHKELLTETNKINISCPVMINKDVRADNVVVLNENTIQYNFTIVNYSKNQLDVKKFKKITNPLILYAIKTNSDFKIFRDHQVSIIYSCRDKNGVLIHSVKYDYNDYK